MALLGERATPDQIAAAEKIYGLDRPIWEQYVKFLGQAVTLNFGSSQQTQRPVLEEIGRRLPATIELSLAALLFALIVGVPLGYLAARRHNGWLDRLAVTGSLVGISVPVFFLAFIMKWIFAVHWRILPSDGRQNIRLDVDHPTGFYVLDGLLTGNPEATWDAAMHLVLPAFCLGTIPLAIVTRITRAAVLDVLNEDYVRTAQSKGLTSTVIRNRHVLRNALLPVLTIAGLQLGLLLSGAVLTETVFGIAGMGSFMASAIFARDYNTIEGFILLAAVLVVCVNLLIDVLYGLVDPRVRVR